MIRLEKDFPKTLNDLVYFGGFSDNVPSYSTDRISMSPFPFYEGPLVDTYDGDEEGSNGTRIGTWEACLLTLNLTLSLSNEI